MIIIVDDVSDVNDGDDDVSDDNDDDWDDDDDGGDDDVNEDETDNDDETDSVVDDVLTEGYLILLYEVDRLLAFECVSLLGFLSSFLSLLLLLLLS